MLSQPSTSTFVTTPTITTTAQQTTITPILVTQGQPVFSQGIPIFDRTNLTTYYAPIQPSNTPALNPKIASLENMKASLAQIFGKATITIHNEQSDSPYIDIDFGATLKADAGKKLLQKYIEKAACFSIDQQIPPKTLRLSNLNYPLFEKQHLSMLQNVASYLNAHFSVVVKVNTGSKPNALIINASEKATSSSSTDSNKTINPQNLDLPELIKDHAETINKIREQAILLNNLCILPSSCRCEVDESYLFPQLVIRYTEDSKSELVSAYTALINNWIIAEKNADWTRANGSLIMSAINGENLNAVYKKSLDNVAAMLTNFIGVTCTVTSDNPPKIEFSGDANENLKQLVNLQYCEATKNNEKTQLSNIDIPRLLNRYKENLKTIAAYALSSTGCYVNEEPNSKNLQLKIPFNLNNKNQVNQYLKKLKDDYKITISYDEKDDHVLITSVDFLPLMQLAQAQKAAMILKAPPVNCTNITSVIPSNYPYQVSLKATLTFPKSKCSISCNKTKIVYSDFAGYHTYYSIQKFFALFNFANIVTTLRQHLNLDWGYLHHLELGNLDFISSLSERCSKMRDDGFIDTLYDVITYNGETESGIISDNKNFYLPCTCDDNYLLIRHYQPCHERTVEKSFTFSFTLNPIKINADYIAYLEQCALTLQNKFGVKCFIIDNDPNKIPFIKVEATSNNGEFSKYLQTQKIHCDVIGNNYHLYNINMETKSPKNSYHHHSLQFAKPLLEKVFGRTIFLCNEQQGDKPASIIIDCPQDQNEQAKLKRTLKELQSKNYISEITFNSQEHRFYISQLSLLRLFSDYNQGLENYASKLQTVLNSLSPKTRYTWEIKTLPTEDGKNSLAIKTTNSVNKTCTTIPAKILTSVFDSTVFTKEDSLEHLQLIQLKLSITARVIAERINTFGNLTRNKDLKINTLRSMLENIAKAKTADEIKDILQKTSIATYGVAKERIYNTGGDTEKLFKELIVDVNTWKKQQQAELNEPSHSTSTTAPYYQPSCSSSSSSSSSH